MRLLLIINCFCIKKILFSKIEKRQKKLFFHDFWKKIRKSVTIFIFQQIISDYVITDYILVMRALNNDRTFS